MKPFLFDENAFSELYPFSFIADGQGHFIHLGRSLHKIHSSLKLGDSLAKGFLILRPELQTDFVAPHLLLDDLIVLSHLERPEIRLRGHVVRLHPGVDHFLFNMNPGIQDVSHLIALGMEFGDFAIGDPIFDFLMLSQSQKAAQSKVEAALARVDWENRVSQLLYQITRDTNPLNDAKSVYRVVVDSVCQGLEWEVGNLFLLQEKVDSLESGGVSFCSDPVRFKPFFDLTQELNFRKGHGFPGVAAQEKKIIWSHNVIRDARFGRTDSLLSLNPLTGVAVPVNLQGETVAVLEFYTEQTYKSFDNLIRFFDSLGLLIGGILERQFAQERERIQLANLVNTSKMASLGEIAAGVAHEINNPLAMISIVGQALERTHREGTVDSAGIEKQILRINTAVKRITRIVAGLRDFSRESSQDPFLPTALQAILDEILDLCSSRFYNAGVRLEVSEIKSDLKVACRGSQIGQVLLNLLNNSYDAVSKGVDPWVKIEIFDQEGQVEIAVTDSGRGIPPEVIQKLMRPFFTTKPAGSGTGLGLSISSRIINEHGGTLQLDPGSPNTRFVLNLPKKREALKT